LPCSSLAHPFTNSKHRKNIEYKNFKEEGSKKRKRGVRGKEGSEEKRGQI
jgi:hypothetical protein